MDFDLCIIGAGTGGYVAALKAAQEGKKTLLIEKQALGGTCLNKGCIPTKALLKSAEKWEDLLHCEAFGLKITAPSFSWDKIQTRKTAVITQLGSGIAQLLKANKVTMLTGTAKLAAKNTVSIKNKAAVKTITAENIILATGSLPAKPPINGNTLPGVLTSDELLDLQQLPNSMVIIGAGVIGLEFACILTAFGCKVTLVEMLPSILPPGDIDIQRRLGLALRKKGITVKVKAAVQSIKQRGEELSLAIMANGKEETLAAEKVLIATGRQPNFCLEELNNLGIAYTKHGITVDEHMQTSLPGIYAVGDVTGKSMLAHSAAHQGLVAVANILGTATVMDYKAIPSCVFTQPEIAFVGLTEQQCKEQGLPVAISKFNFAGNGKAITMGETDGLVKLIAEQTTQKILGCHIIGPHASDLIMEGTLAVQQSLTAQQLINTIHPHPTLSEAMSEAALGLFGKMLHQVNLRH